MLNIERPIAHQSSITFFLIHPVEDWLKIRNAQNSETYGGP